jgi:hypothetical protein
MAGNHSRITQYIHDSYVNKDVFILRMGFNQAF